MLAGDLAEAEKAFLRGLSSRRREILEGKRLLLLEKVVNDAGHEDFNLVKDMAKGFDLTGALPEANVFKKKFRPASISCEELRTLAAKSRTALLSSVTGSGDIPWMKG